MSETTLIPYLFFKGQCKEAMEFYKSVFGGELETTDYSDVPAEALGDMGDVKKEWLMHARLSGGAVDLMASDTAKASPETKKVSLALGGNNEAVLSQMFEALSQGGKIGEPLKKQMWGDLYGDLVDKYGVDWMVNITIAKT